LSRWSSCFVWRRSQIRISIPRWQVFVVLITPSRYKLESCLKISHAAFFHILSNSSFPPSYHLTLCNQ
jgi:hypothetical protein